MTFNYFRDDYSRTYDVRANAGDFIIGEVGRIDINSGQTLEVRFLSILMVNRNYLAYLAIQYFAKISFLNLF